MSRAKDHLKEPAQTGEYRGRVSILCRIPRVGVFATMELLLEPRYVGRLWRAGVPAAGTPATGPMAT